MNSTILNDFFFSALKTDDVVFPTSEIFSWISEQNKTIESSIYPVPLSTMKNWSIDDKTGSINHVSGKFFSIIGIQINTNWGNLPEWEQPIINQPEIGFLGIITKKIKGVLYFLLQAKIEPGNINIVQLSPTLQATRSNYTKVHKGKTPLFLEYFNGSKKVQILLDQLQSEQGARFLRKRNRNIIIQVDENELTECPENYKWVTLGQIKQLLRFDNVVNMDTRSVIAAIMLKIPAVNWIDNVSSQINIGNEFIESLLNPVICYNDFDQILSWFTALKFKHTYEVLPVPLLGVKNWIFDKNSIVHEKGKYFEVIGVHSEISNREAMAWDQPMIKPVQSGVIAFIVKKINGVYHFLIQAKLEPGNIDILEMAPTVQCITGNYRLGENEYSVPFIQEVISAPDENIWYSAYQSEEGGRFYKEQNINRIIEVLDDFPVDVPENYCWMTLSQILTFIKFNNYLNISARSLLSAISLYK